MKKVLVIGMTYNEGGVESVIMNYYRNIDKSKIQFDFIRRKKIAYENEILSLGGKIFDIPSLKKHPIKFCKIFNQILKENNYDAIWYNTCLLANIEFLKIAKKNNIKKIIVHSHNSKNIQSFVHYIFHRINKHIVHKYATDFWSCSKEAGEFFYTKKIIQSDKHKIINNAIDIDKYSFNQSVRDKYRKNFGLNDCYVIGNVGRLHFQKNQEFLIKVFAKVLEKSKNSRLLLIGQGEDEQELKKLVKDLNIEKEVLFLGIRKDIENLLQALDIFAFPSLFEGLPVVLIEAQASGVNILASNTISEESKINDNLEFLPLEENIWVEKLCELKNNEIDRVEVSKKLISSKYDIRTQVKDFENSILNK